MFPKTVNHILDDHVHDVATRLATELGYTHVPRICTIKQGRWEYIEVVMNNDPINRPTRADAWLRIHTKHADGDMYKVSLVKRVESAVDSVAKPAYKRRGKAIELKEYSHQLVDMLIELVEEAEM